MTGKRSCLSVRFKKCHKGKEQGTRRSFLVNADKYFFFVWYSWDRDKLVLIPFYSCLLIACGPFLWESFDKDMHGNMWSCLLLLTHKLLFEFRRRSELVEKSGKSYFLNHFLHFCLFNSELRSWVDGSCWKLCEEDRMLLFQGMRVERTPHSGAEPMLKGQKGKRTFISESEPFQRRWLEKLNLVAMMLCVIWLHYVSGGPLEINGFQLNFMRVILFLPWA